MKTPNRKRVYQNHHIDSTRWETFKPRADDIVVATSIKAGTTWTQAMVANLLFPDQSFPAPVWELNPWIDFRGVPLEMIMDGLDQQTHRRCVKTHLPIDALPFYPQLKYIYVGRDGRDVAMSLWNHHAKYSAQAYAEANETPGLVGDVFPKPPQDFHLYWREWCTKGWFEWENDGYPFWSHLQNVQSWWDYRDLPNILFMHYADMKRDTPAAIRKIAGFLEIPVGDAQIQAVTDAVTLDAMRGDADNYVPDGGTSWEGGAKTFLHKGTNGRWRDLLSDAELQLYEQACDRELNPECRRWLEHGGDAKAF